MRNPFTKFMESLRSAVLPLAKSAEEQATVDAALDDAEAALATELDSHLDDPTDIDRAFDAALGDDWGDDEADDSDGDHADRAISGATGADAGTPGVTKGISKEGAMPDQNAVSEAVLKSLGVKDAEDLRTRLAKADQLEAQVTALEQTNKTLATSVQKMLDDEAQRVAVSKATQLLGTLASPEDRVARFAAIVRKLDEAEVATLGEVLASASAALETAQAFQPAPIVKGGGADSAYGKLETISKGLREKDASLTPQAAMSLAMQLNPALAKQAVEAETMFVTPTTA